eukprot:13221037-Ditylum_brightwellii.AAC.1
MTGDIRNAFCTALCTAKIWSITGDQFGKRKGAIAVLERALYGLKLASASFHDFLGDFLCEMGFVPIRVDQDLWIKKSDNYPGYDYIVMHVDNLIIASKEFTEINELYQAEFSSKGCD